MKAALSCLKIIIVLLVFFLIGATIFNVVNNPYDVFGPSLVKRPVDLTSQSFLTKAIGIIRYKPDTIITGTSIVDAGFRLSGSTTLFHDDGFNEKKLRLESTISEFLPIYNAGVRGGGMYEILAYIKHAYKNNPHLKHIILGIEWGIFTYARMPTKAVPETPALGKNYIPLSVYLQKSLSWRSTYDSFRTFAEHNNKARKISNSIDTIFTTATMCLNKTLESIGLEKLIAPVNQSHLTQSLISARNVSETNIFFFSLLTISSFRSMSELFGQDALVNPKALAVLQEIVNFTQQNNIKLDVYISPHHPIYWSFVRGFGLEEYVDEWLRAVGKITPYWDFSTQIDFNEAVNNYFSTDPLHFNELGGEIILPAILKNDKQFTYVTDANIESNIKRRHAELTRWLNQNQYISDILVSDNMWYLYNVSTNMENIYIIKYQSSYKNYNIFWFKDGFLALKSGDAPYDLKNMMLNKYDNLTATSLSNLYSQIDNDVFDRTAKV